MKLEQKYIELAETYKGARDFFYVEAQKDEITEGYYNNLGRWFVNAGRELRDCIKDDRFVDKASKEKVINHLSVAEDLIKKIDGTSSALSLVYDAFETVESMKIQDE